VRRGAKLIGCATPQAVAGLAAVGGNLLGKGAHPNGVAVETAAAGSEFPSYGAYQSGIITPPPDSRQPFSTYAAFDVTAANRSELTDLFRTLTVRAAFLTAGGTAPTAPAGSPPPDNPLAATEPPREAATQNPSNPPVIRELLPA
jgi:deferrochelatase/peroxidase EfeB